MKVATRLTLATALAVAITASAYAVYDVRARREDRRATVDRHARAMATTLAATLEQRPDLQANDPRTTPLDPTALLNVQRASTDAWKVEIVPRAVVAVELGEPVVLGLAARFTAAQARRLRAFVDFPDLVVCDEEADRVFCAAPMRQRPGDGPPLVLGVIEVSTSGARLREQATDDVWRALWLVGVIAAAATLAVAALATGQITRRVSKLLRGIDDVAQGDLSHVLLADRDDEIGKIATRFNDMTQSLRASRAETQTQNQAKVALEQKLGQTEKLATIGQLAAEIAHEVGTPLNVIAGRARATQKRAQDPVAVEKNAVIIAEQTARITRIIQRLLDFTRRKVGAAAITRIQLETLTSTTLELLAGQFSKAKVRVHWAPPAKLAPVTGDADRLQQVLINLVLNGQQAMDGGGDLWLATDEVVRTRPGLDDAVAQRFVRLSVRDNGPGIPADIRDKIFDPFYTTKEDRGGTGLGLAVCSGIVKEHDGWIEVDDAVGGGAEFRVFVPATEGR